MRCSRGHGHDTPLALRHVVLLALVVTAVAGCAGIGLHEPLRVSLAGLEPLEGGGLEARFVAKIRVQNPNEAAISYNGISAQLDLNGKSFASGVSDASGEIPRFGEGVIDMPLTVPATAIVRQVMGFVTGSAPTKGTYHVRGFINTGTFGRAPFDSTGEVDLPNFAGK